MKMICVFLFLALSCKQKAVVEVPKSDEEAASAESEGDSSADASAETAPEDDAVVPEATTKTTTPAPAPATTPVVTNEAKTAVIALDNTVVELPCKDYLATKYDCNTVADIDRSMIIGGDPKTTYEVELRFRGLVEPMLYSGGMSDGKNFYTGGVPADPVYNIYRLTTENPKQVYYLNYLSPIGAYVFAIDYTAKIKVVGGSTVKLFASAQNGSIISNNKNVTVPELNRDVAHGQFVQINVVSAVALKATTP